MYAGWGGGVGLLGTHGEESDRAGHREETEKGRRQAQAAQRTNGELLQALERYVLTFSTIYSG